MNRDWIDSFPKNIPECITHKILNLRPIHPVAELLKSEFDLLMRDVDTDRYPIVKEGGNKLETWQEEDPKSERATKKFQIYLEVKEKAAMYNKIKQELKMLLFNNRSLITET